MNLQNICGFSRLNKEAKIDLVVEKYCSDPNEIRTLIKSFWHSDKERQKHFDEFSENTLTNFVIPYGVVPHLRVNEKNYCVPMVTEESSVVAAASKSSKYWAERGGFHSEILGTTKVGQVHLIWNGRQEKLINFFEKRRDSLVEKISPLFSRMKERGGGLKDIQLLDKTDLEAGYFQIFATFETCNAMGANFINTILEAIGKEFKLMVEKNLIFKESERELMVVMAIVSNFTPECKVRSWVKCPIKKLDDGKLGMDPFNFAKKIQLASKIAKIDQYRAVTHNKGIFNGMDAVAIATGNDFRAIEAAGHAFAAMDGQYKGLTEVKIDRDQFLFSIEVPLPLGIVGGITDLHPLVDVSMDLLGRPSAEELMQIMSSIGLAQNFGALRSLVTSGIQKGHMKMHLLNIINSLGATEEERTDICKNFKNKAISYKEVSDYIAEIREYH